MINVGDVYYQQGVNNSSMNFITSIEGGKMDLTGMCIEIAEDDIFIGEFSIIQNFLDDCIKKIKYE